MHKHPKHHTKKLNPLEKLEKFIMATKTEILAAIKTIVKGAPTDPAILADVADVKLQLKDALDRLAANDANDAESKQIVTDQMEIIEAMVEALKNAPPSDSTNDGETETVIGATES